MIRADHNIQTEEVSVLRKIVIGLAFPLHEVDRIVDEAITINTDSTDVESFTKAMLKLMHLK
jgi:uncharacterized tellurite resistance protein B-like protein